MQAGEAGDSETFRGWKSPCTITECVSTIKKEEDAKVKNEDKVMGAVPVACVSAAGYASQCRGTLTFAGNLGVMFFISFLFKKNIFLLCLEL